MAGDHACATEAITGGGILVVLVGSGQNGGVMGQFGGGTRVCIRGEWMDLLTVANTYFLAPIFLLIPPSEAKVFSDLGQLYASSMA